MVKDSAVTEVSCFSMVQIPLYGISCYRSSVAKLVHSFLHPVHFVMLFICTPLNYIYALRYPLMKQPGSYDDGVIPVR